MMRRMGLSALSSLLLAGVGPALAGQPLTADALLRQMTPEEKVGQLGQLFYVGSTDLEGKIRAGSAGSVLYGSDPQVVNRLQHIAVEQSRLHIPLLFGTDVIHGLRTIFPVPLALAASWDPDLVAMTQSVSAAEARAVGIHWTFAPMVDIARDPRWGRIVEGAGEDPFLGSAMSAAQVRGFQGGKKVQPNHVMACVKHFAGYGAALGGRDYDEVNLSTSELWNVYLPPFKAAVDAGTRTVMSAYMGLNGVPASGNRWLLTDVLRKTWDFDGFVVSDANAVRNLTTHGFAANAPDAALRALTAGVDMEMSIGKPVTAELANAVRDHKVDSHVIDAAVRRLLQAKIDLGLFANPYVDEGRAQQVLAAPEHRTAARVAAERAAVLLRNEGGLLPLDREHLHSIAVVGPYADSKRDVVGPWAFEFQLEETKTIADGIRDFVGPGVKVDVAPGIARPARKYLSPFVALDRTPKTPPWSPEEAVREFSRAESLSRTADVVVLVLGEGWDMSGESASVSTLSLSGEQQHLLETVVAGGKPVVLVLVNGRPLDISWASTHVPAILESWFPGTQGGAAVANLLFGQSVPGGKLPVTWPRNVGQVPIIYARATSHAPGTAAKRYWNEEGSPLYPFGYGLSYTTFSYSEPHVEQSSIRIGAAVQVSIDITNSGSRSGDEVVQLYIHQRFGRALRPVRELKGFQRIQLAPQETRHITFTLSGHDLQYWSTADAAWVQDPATFDVWIGTNSEAPAHAQFEVHR